MILKSDHRHRYQIALQYDIVNQTSFALLCVQIYQIQPLDHSLFCLIILAKELIAATYCDDHTPIFHLFFKIRLNLLKLWTHEHLRGV